MLYFSQEGWKRTVRLIVYQTNSLESPDFPRKTARKGWKWDAVSPGKELIDLVGGLGP